MRKLCFLIVGVTLTISLALLCRQVTQPKHRTIALPDGSQLTLLQVTHGTNHVCVYGKRPQDLFHSLLPQKLRNKFPPRVMTYTSGSGNTVMAWLRHDGGTPSGGWPPPFFLAVADENDLESCLLRGAEATRTLSGFATMNPSAKLVSQSQISGWEMPEFPRRSGRFKLRIYREESSGKVGFVGEFSVHNLRPGKFPTWTAEALPAVRQTNRLEMILTKLETGLTSGDTGVLLANERAKSYSRARFILKENGMPTEKWDVHGIKVSNAAGETRPHGFHGWGWWCGELRFDFEGALWLEESAWKFEVDFARTGNFPADELWRVEDVPVPRPGELLMARAVTNLHFAELEFLGVSGAGTALPADYAAIQPHANIHVRTPHPLDGVRLALVEVRDDQGRQLKSEGSTARIGMGGRGNTPKETLHGFAIEIPTDARSLEVIFAATRVQRAVFLAKPALTAMARGN